LTNKINTSDHALSTGYLLRGELLIFSTCFFTGQRKWQEGKYKFIKPFFIQLKDNYDNKK
jgi:hypothetical protein